MRKVYKLSVRKKMLQSKGGSPGSFIAQDSGLFGLDSGPQAAHIARYLIYRVDSLLCYE
jgi:hypothetical protein